MTCSTTHLSPFARRCHFSAYLSTLFLGALNDNISKLLVICFGTCLLGSSSPAASTFMVLAAAMFILPYLLFSSIAGFLADRFSKKSIMVWSKVAEILIMALGFILARFNTLYSLLFVLFLMGTQSAFFSPAKYGFLPETHTPEELSKANGLTQLWTFLAIILGGYAGGQLSAHYPTNIAGGFIWCIAIAVIGTLTSIGMTPTPPGNPQCRFTNRDPITPHIRTLKKLSSDKTLLAAVLGNSFFWFFGTIFQLVLIPLAQNSLQGDNSLIGNLQGCAALGIGLGCTAAGIMAKKRITYTWVAPSILVTAAAAFFLSGCTSSLPCVVTAIALMGISTGFFQLPLSTAIQHRSPAAERGRYLGACNALDCLFMLAANFVLWLLQNPCRLQAAGVMAVLGVLLTVVSFIYFTLFNIRKIHE